MRKTTPRLSRLSAAIRAAVPAGLGLGAVLSIPAAFAGPSGEQIAAGNVAIARPDGPAYPSLSSKPQRCRELAVLLGGQPGVCAVYSAGLDVRSFESRGRRQ